MKKYEKPTIEIKDYKLTETVSDSICSSMGSANVSSEDGIIIGGGIFLD